MLLRRAKLPNISGCVPYNPCTTVFLQSPSSSPSAQRDSPECDLAWAKSDAPAGAGDAMHTAVKGTIGALVKAVPVDEDAHRCETDLGQAGGSGLYQAL